MDSGFSAMDARIANVEGNNPAYSSPPSTTWKCKRPPRCPADVVADTVTQKVAKRLCKLGLQESDSSDTDTEDNIATPVMILRVKTHQIG